MAKESSTVSTSIFLNSLPFFAAQHYVNIYLSTKVCASISNNAFSRSKYTFVNIASGIVTQTSRFSYRNFNIVTRVILITFSIT